MTNTHPASCQPQFPGISEFLGNSVLPSGLFLLAGPPGTGKTMYCRQFLTDGLANGDHCVFLSSAIEEKQPGEMFSAIDHRLENDNLLIVNPCSKTHSRKEISAKLSSSLRDIRKVISKAKDNSDSNMITRVAVDSLSHLLLLCGRRALVKLVIDLSAMINDTHTTIICTLTNTGDDLLSDTLSPLAAGILEMKFEDSNSAFKRSIRLLSVKGLHHIPKWVNFKIMDSGQLLFGEQSIADSESTCTLCGKPIIGTPIMYSDFVFDKRSCVETYKKLSSVLGTNIAEIGLPSEAFDVSFFYIDIVGSSDPTLSIKNQVLKIEALNKLISSCDAFRKAKKGKRIILTTGDGMAIGFLLNPELPLELSIELHRKIRIYNNGKQANDQLGIRIGLASGLVFTVTDMNNVQNVWGPGIILARRVMDAGDDGHILLADNLAEGLIALKDEYRSIIKPICTAYEIKHGQKISLYSAYSNEFGNSELPERVPH